MQFLGKHLVLFICKRLKKLEHLTRWRFVTKIIKKSKKEEEEEDKICSSHIFVFGGEKKCLFSRRVEEWEMRTWHHSEVGQECWSPVSFWGWKKRCKIAASLMSKQGKSRMVGMVYILFYKLGQKINDVLLTKHFLQDLNTGLWFSKDIKKKDCKLFLDGKLTSNHISS